MLGFISSLLMGLAVGVVYGLVQVRSPAPPLIALIGLLGMVVGEQAVDLAKRHFMPPAQTSGDLPVAFPAHSARSSPGKGPPNLSVDEDSAMMR